jgi:hypothetical protein
MFVTLKVFKLIGPSNDVRRHGRGTYLLHLEDVRHLLHCNDNVTITERERETDIGKRKKER